MISSRSLTQAREALHEALKLMDQAERDQGYAYAYIAEAHRVAGNGTASLAAAKFFASREQSKQGAAA